MIRLYFRTRAGMTIIKVIGTSIFFSNDVYGFNADIPIDNMKLFINGILKEFPDLADRPIEEAREEAIKRFKSHLQSMGNEEEIAKYLIEEGKKEGAVLQRTEKGGSYRR